MLIKSDYYEKMMLGCETMLLRKRTEVIYDSETKDQSDFTPFVQKTNMNYCVLFVYTRPNVNQD